MDKKTVFPKASPPEEIRLKIFSFYLSSAGITQFRFKGSPRYIRDSQA
jgi:hypothetical protein